MQVNTFLDFYAYMSSSQFLLYIIETLAVVRMEPRGYILRISESAFGIDFILVSIRDE